MNRSLYITSRVLLGAALFFCWAGGAAEPVELTVRATGYTDGVGYAARDRAIADAKQRALVEVMRSLVASEDLKLFRPMLRQTDVYIRRFDLLRTDEVGGDTRVELDAHVLETPLHRDIAAIMLPRLPQKPKVLLLIGEQLPGDPMLAVPDFGVAELALKKVLEDKGLVVRGADTLDEHYPYAKLIEIVHGGIEPRSQFALGAPDHVVVVGAATATAAGGEAVNAMKRSTAQVKLDIFRGSDGKKVDDVSVTAVVHGVSDHEACIAAIQDACGKAQTNVLTAAAIGVLSTQASDQLLITVLRPETQERLDLVAALLESHPYAGRAEQLFFSPGLGRLALPYDGGMGDLSDYLSGAAVSGAQLKVTRVLKREVELTLD